MRVSAVSIHEYGGDQYRLGEGPQAMLEHYATLAGRTIVQGFFIENWGEDQEIEELLDESDIGGSSSLAGWWTCVAPRSAGIPHFAQCWGFHVLAEPEAPAVGDFWDDLPEFDLPSSARSALLNKRVYGRPHSRLGHGRLAGSRAYRTST